MTDDRSNLGYGYSSWPTYRAQYDKASASWSSNNGPSDSDCQFYQGSSLAIWVRLGDGSIQGGEQKFCVSLVFADHQ